VTTSQERLSNFLAIEGAERPRAIVLPLPYEATTSYLQGTARGPQAILEASTQVELLDEDAGDEPYRLGLATRHPLDVGGDPETVIRRIADAVESELMQGRFVCSLGGEHTVTVGCVRGAARIEPGLAVVSIDAHADLRDTYRGSPHSHACVMRRLSEDGHDIVEAGIRSLSSGEAEALPGLDVVIVTGREIDASRRNDGGRKWTERVLGAVAGRAVYLSVDLDGLDPSVVPGVGTPEPGGLLWYETLDLIAGIFATSTVVAADVVELCPRPDDIVSSFAAARLVYKILGYALRSRPG
jgi:agmatinase